jgi:lactoylglutathione lyase
MLKLNLIVIRTETPEETGQWYSEIFGLQFIAEKHDDGVLHYSAKLADALFEIYPTDKISSKITFGFAVDKIDFEKIAARVNHKIIGKNLILLKDIVGNSIIVSLSE